MREEPKNRGKRREGQKRRWTAEEKELLGLMGSEGEEVKVGVRQEGREKRKEQRNVKERKARQEGAGDGCEKKKNG